MTLAALFLAFAAATAAGQALLRGDKVQARLGRVAAIHLLIALPLMVALARWGETSPWALLLFWSGAGLTWFVVRSHLESSILLAMLDEVARGTSDRDELRRRLPARHGAGARIRELETAGLIDNGAELRITRKGRLVSTFFAALEGVL